MVDLSYINSVVNLEWPLALPSLNILLRAASVWRATLLLYNFASPFRFIAAIPGATFPDFQLSDPFFPR